VFNILQYELVNCLDDSSDNEKENISTKYKIVAQSELQKIATRPKLLPYNDVRTLYNRGINILTDIFSGITQMARDA
jgi:hypothetical protein